MSNLSKEKLKKVVLDASYDRDGKKFLNCKSALQIAEKEFVPVRDVGEMCNTLKIKIEACQLGCFK